MHLKQSHCYEIVKLKHEKSVVGQHSYDYRCTTSHSYMGSACPKTISFRVVKDLKDIREKRMT